MLLLCALWAAPALAAQSVKLKVAFDPDRAGASTTIVFGFTVSGSGGQPPSPVTSTDLRAARPTRRSASAPHSQ